MSRDEEKVSERESRRVVDLPFRSRQHPPTHPLTPPLKTSLFEQQIPRRLDNKREVAKREENRHERAESACLSSLMMQSGRNTPPLDHTHTHSSITSPNPPPNPACSSGDITSLRSNMAENSCRAACGCWKFFPTEVTVLEAVTGAAEIRDSNSLLSVENSRLGDENPVVTNLDLKEGKQNETDL